MNKNIYKVFYVVIGIILIAVASKVYYDASIKNNKMGWYVIEGSYADNYLKNTHPADINYIENKEEIKSNEKFEYTILADGTLQLNEYKGNNKSLVIPEVIDGKKVSIINFNGEFRKITVPEGIRAITGNLEVTNKIEPSQLSVLAIFAVTLLIYITVVISATKKFDIKVSFLSLMYLLVPIIYTLATHKYKIISGKYDYTYLALMLVTTIVYLIITAIIVGYSKDKVEAKPAAKKSTAKKATTKKTTTAKKKTTTKKK